MCQQCAMAAIILRAIPTALILTMERILRYRNKQKGFTLIELLVVISVIGFLASVILVSLNSARAKARDARIIADFKQINNALDLFYDKNNRMPNNYNPGFGACN